MFRLKETLYVVLASLVIGYVVSLSDFSFEAWGKFSLLGLAILLTNIIAKKLVAYYLGCEVEVFPWQIQRFWIYKNSYFKSPVPVWLLWPVFVAWMTAGRIWWLVVLNFEVLAKKSKISKKFAELTEWELALIAASGIIANLIVAAASQAYGFVEFRNMNLWFVFFNMLPFAGHDGGKIFFGGRFFYVFMLTIALAAIILLNITNIITTVISSVLIGIIAVSIFYALRRSV